MLRTTLKPRLETLPLILCGPILRRTQPDSVTVWVALRKPRTVRLEVSVREASGGWTPPRLTGVAQTVALGADLHVVAVTAKGDKPLAWGDLCGYDLSFEAAPGAAADTAGLGRLFSGAANGRTGVFAADEATARKALTYQHVDARAPDLPSFVLPPDDAKSGGRHPLNHLRVCHGSCRKAHGESLDGLASMDVILTEALKPGATDPRPHMLLLTGDQIYADDVADALLELLMDAGDTLLGYTEMLPGETYNPGGGDRAALSERLGLTAAKGKPEYGKSHLLRFSEYAAMYLFAWSDVLWPAQLPAMSEIYNGYLEGIARSKKGSTFRAEVAQLELFRQTLPQVRRALANVPVYMIFDDHEISDDWYLNLQWTSGLLSRENPRGRRVIMNGLMAYAIFQAWGNTPEQFKEGDSSAAGWRLLQAASKWQGKTGEHEAEIFARLNIPTYDGVVRAGGDDGPQPVLRWHHTIQTPGFLCLMLDTRTMRGFPGQLLDPPELLNHQGFALQIDGAPQAPADGITVVVATTNVFSEPLTELGIDIVQGLHPFDPEIRTFDPDQGDAWAPQSRTYERLLAKLADRAPDTGGSAPRRTRVVIATGDIHYGFAVRAQYWGERPYVAPGDRLKSDKPAEAVIAQFTASSFRNEIAKTRALHDRAFLTVWNKPRLSELMTGSYIGWRTPPGSGAFVPWDVVGVLGEALNRDVLDYVVRKHRSKERSEHLEATPAVLRVDGLPALSKVSTPPDWRYRINFIKDRRPTPVEGVRLQAGGEAKDRAAQAAALSEAHRNYAKSGSGRIVVGRNNVGELRFSWGPGDDKTAIQKLWWRLTDQAEPAPLTDYAIPLGFSVSQYPKPTYPGEK